MAGAVLTSYAERLLQLYTLLEQTQQRAFEILQDEQIELANPFRQQRNLP